MAEKQDPVNAALPEGTSTPIDAGLEKKPEPGLTAAPASQETAPSDEKTPADDAAKGFADLSVADDKTTEEVKASAIVPPPVVETPAAAATAPTDDSVTATQGLFWPETAPEHPLTKFYDAFEALVKEAEHNEVYGIELSKSNPFLTKLILQKFLRANQNDLNGAKGQLLETLKWRKTFDPVKAAGESFERSKFDGLGYILNVEGVPGSPNATDVVTFNIYGAVKDNKATFGDLDAFLRWRVGLMEKSIQALNLSAATKPIPNFGEGPDPYQGFQVHDYLQVSFLRRDPLVKTATSKTIEVLGKHYPETLSRKFFVNVPVVMGWVYTAMKMVVAKETAKKFTVLSYGKDLAGELGKNVPKEYGGDKSSLQEVGKAVKFLD
ncbi:Non-classical phosphatidylinositol transfer protein (PITP) [Plenodomus lindquistii]|nr:Non-classical phosphatidylinositol transfer protein (PITP) [Plenodomus lindquistii]